MIDEDYTFYWYLEGHHAYLLPLRAKSKLQLKDCQVAMLVIQKKGPCTRGSH